MTEDDIKVLTFRTEAFGQVLEAMRARGATDESTVMMALPDMERFVAYIRYLESKTKVLQ